MAKKAGLAQKLFQGIYDISGDVSAIGSWSTPVGVLDITGIDKSAHERVQGAVGGALSYNVFFNDAAAAAHVASKVPATSTVITWAMGQAVGDVAGMMAGVGTSYDPTRAADGMLTFDIETVGNSTAPVWGVMLTPGAKTDTSAANGATLDQGAQTTSGAEAILHVTSFTGSNFTATVQDSSNGSSWGTLKAFTQVTGTGTERVTVSGTVERYVRVISAGTFNPVTFAVSFRRGESVDRVTYS
jgi:hypothetical protein